MVFVAGTASVVGHETRHAGDIEAQLEETLLNLETIIAEAASRTGKKGSLDNLSIAKTYIRNASDYEMVSRFSSVSPSCASMSPAWRVWCPTTLAVPATKTMPAPSHCATVARANDGLREP